MPQPNSISLKSYNSVSGRSVVDANARYNIVKNKKEKQKQEETNKTISTLLKTIPYKFFKGSAALNPQRLPPNNFILVCVCVLLAFRAFTVIEANTIMDLDSPTQFSLMTGALNDTSVLSNLTNVTSIDVTTTEEQTTPITPLSTAGGGAATDISPGGSQYTDSPVPKISDSVENFYSSIHPAIKNKPQVQIAMFDLRSDARRVETLFEKCLGNLRITRGSRSKRPKFNVAPRLDNIARLGSKEAPPSYAEATKKYIPNYQKPSTDTYDNIRDSILGLDPTGLVSLAAEKIGAKEPPGKPVEEAQLEMLATTMGWIEHIREYLFGIGESLSKYISQLVAVIEQSSEEIMDDIAESTAEIGNTVTAEAATLARSFNSTRTYIEAKFNYISDQADRIKRSMDDVISLIKSINLRDMVDYFINKFDEYVLVLYRRITDFLSRKTTAIVNKTSYYPHIFTYLNNRFLFLEYTLTAILAYLVFRDRFKVLLVLVILFMCFGMLRGEEIYMPAKTIIRTRNSDISRNSKLRMRKETQPLETRQGITNLPTNTSTVQKIRVRQNVLSRPKTFNSKRVDPIHAFVVRILHSARPMFSDPTIILTVICSVALAYSHTHAPGLGLLSKLSNKLSNHDPTKFIGEWMNVNADKVLGIMAFLPNYFMISTNHIPYYILFTTIWVLFLKTQHVWYYSAQSLCVCLFMRSKSSGDKIIMLLLAIVVCYYTSELSQ